MQADPSVARPLQGSGAVFSHRLPLPSELEVACRAGHLCGFTATLPSPPHTSLFPWGLRKGRDSSLAQSGHPAGFWAWGYLLEATPEWRERERCARKPLGRAPGGMCSPQWLYEGSSPMWGTCGRWCCWICCSSTYLKSRYVYQTCLLSTRASFWTDCFLEVPVSRKPWRARLLAS